MVCHIETSAICQYLVDYQEKNGSSKVTIDNMRRVFSSFFAWLEDEDYIHKSPVRRIHKVKTDVLVREILSDEQLEQLRDSCTEKRDLDLTAYEVYDAYDDRWKIEPYEKLCKSIMENGAVNVHSNPSVRATTFINGISNILGCRLRKLMKDTGVSKNYSTKEVLRKLRHFMMQMDEDGNWQPTPRVKKIAALAQAL